MSEPRDRLYARFLRMNPLRFVGARFGRLGDHFVTVQDDIQTVATRSPAHLTALLRSDDFGRVPNPLEPVLLNGLLVLEGEPWGRHRRALGPAFQPSAVQSLADATRNAARTHLRQWSPGSCHLRSAIRNLVIDVTFRTLFDHTALHPELPQALDLAAILSGAHRLGRSVSDDDASLWTRLHRVLDQQTDLLMAARAPQPVLDTLLSLHSSGAWNEDETRSEVRTLFLAGIDNVASSLIWTTWFLQGEHRTFALESSEHLQWAIQESLRLHPPAYAIPRQAIRPTKLGDLSLEAGDQVVAWTYWIHRDQRWWPNPTTFDPMRFARQRPNPGHYAPFGLGRHHCLGKHLAVLQLRILTDELLRHWSVHWPAEPKPVPLMTLQPSTDLPALLHHA